MIQGATLSADKPPFSPLALAQPRVRRTDLGNGSFLLQSEEALGDYAAHMGLLLKQQAAAQPDTVFLAERNGSAGWREVTYGEAWTAARNIAQALLDRGLDQSRPILILSGNSIDHALLMLGGFVAGVPVVPVSTAYSLMSGDFAKVHHIFDLAKPKLVFAEKGAVFAKALASLPRRDIEIVVSDAAPDGIQATLFSSLLQTRATQAVDARFAAIQPDWVAKYLFTSGSTGLPKGVINTHRMMSSNQQAIAQIWPFLQESRLVLLDWLPWNHTFGGNHNFNMVLRHGGTLYIDDGKPAPGLVEKTVANLREVSPSIYFNVPAGYAMLIPHLEKDDALCRRFFQNLNMIFYAGAALPPDLWSRLEALSIKTLGHRVTMTSSWGSTETAPLATAAHFPIERAGVIGVPVPGVQLKFVPNGAKLEIRVKGPNVTPGYLGQPETTAKAFDEDGFYCIGDACKLADEADPNKGLVFDGRIAEDFKLTTGTWVHVGGIRVAALAACSPLLQDAVVTGQDASYIGLLAWPTAAAKELPPEELARQIAEKLRAHNAAQRGSSLQVKRVLLLSEPPSIDANEITDKGYINQRATLERRHADVKRLYAEPPGDGVIVITDA
ncbi:feruloyl-CoA synthase [uncultured Ferrovibrio sp.]|jgi:feruloyl-CoA synthase|uniref:feruloyl-CoA synthase n=1 Tax=uncultured Ferrovibrio sp. TaxID=1576913 RepID=UPI0026379D73|nr:feruloyl-CoA synthase [uncultured Ferrovibrio sp.]